MEKLVIECDSLSQIGSQINSVAKQMEELGNEIKGYSLPDTDEFNFTTPGSAISSNVLNCAEKMTNTAKIINTVVENHTELQNSLSFDEFVTEKEKKAAEALAAQQAAEVRKKAAYYTPAYYAAASSAAAYESAGATTSEDPTSLADQVLGLTDQPTETPVEKETPTEIETPKEKETDIKEKIISSIKYGGTLIAPIMDYIFNSREEKIDERIEAEYDEETGFAKLEDSYIIRCNEELGKIGDKLVITTASGATISCVIGSTYKADETTEDKIEFFTKNEEGFELTEELPNSEDEIVQIDNYGSIDEEKFKESPAEEIDNIDSQEETPQEETNPPVEDTPKEPETLEDEEKPEEPVDDGFPELIVEGNTNEIIVSSNTNEVVVEPQTPVTPQEPAYNWESVTPEITITSNTQEVIVTPSGSSANLNSGGANIHASGVISGILTETEEEKDDE